MVSKSIDEGLLRRIQTFVANHINSHRLTAVTAGGVEPEDVYILAFSRILGNWQAVATVEDTSVGYYQLSHDGSLDQTIVTVYHTEFTEEAIV